MKKIIARIALFLGRYKLVNRPPDEPVMLLIAAPHTSNWDFMLMLFMAWASDLSPRWLGKREMFDGFLGPVFKRLGGVSVDRDNPGNLPLGCVDCYAAALHVCLCRRCTTQPLTQTQG